MNTQEFLKNKLGQNSGWQIKEKITEGSVTFYDINIKGNYAYSFSVDPNAKEVNFDANDQHLSWYWGHGNENKIIEELAQFIELLSEGRVNQSTYRILGVWPVTRLEVEGNAPSYLRPPKYLKKIASLRQREALGV